MFVAAVLDPSVLSNEYFALDGYKSQAKQLLRGIQENGMLIFDPQNKLRTDVERALINLPTRYNQELLIRWEELQKNKQKRLVSCCNRRFMATSQSDTNQIVHQLASSCDVDAVFTSNQSIPKNLSLQDYDNSLFEEKRRNFFAGSLPIDQITKNDVQDLLVRSVRYAKWIRFYDKQLGRGERIKAFYSGVEYILDLWLQHGHFPELGRKVEIYTTEKRRIEARDAPHIVANKEKENSNAFDIIKSRLIRPLNKKFNWPFNLHIKKDPGHITHARHFETQISIIRSDIGFDLLNTDGTFKRNQFSVDNNFSDALNEYRNLPDAAYL